MTTVDPETLWTVDDAAHLLDPPMTPAEIRALIRLASIPIRGRRPTGRRGRPARLYDPTDLQRAHAAVAHLLT